MDRREFMKGLGIGGAVVAGGLALPPLIAETFGPDEPETGDAREPSFWELDTGPSPHVPRLSEDIEIDVAVIGAGITGLSAAWTLKKSQPDLEVCLLDSHRPCSGASSRNSAHMRGEYHAWKSILRSKGPEAAAEWNGFTQRGLESALEFLKANDIECGLHEEPFLWAGTETRAKSLENRIEDEMKERMPWTRKLKVTHRWLGPVAMTYSSCPIAGPLRTKGQYVAAGYSGSGMVDGFYHGKLVALQMLGESHPDFRYLRGPSGWIPPEPHRAIGAKTFFFFGL